MRDDKNLNEFSFGKHTSSNEPARKKEIVR